VDGAAQKLPRGHTGCIAAVGMTTDAFAPNYGHHLRWEFVWAISTQQRGTGARAGRQNVQTRQHIQGSAGDGQVPAFSEDWGGARGPGRFLAALRTGKRPVRSSAWSCSQKAWPVPERNVRICSCQMSYPIKSRTYSAIMNCIGPLGRVRWYCC
jgi:hypothetical protein